ncbi:MAG: hypothetical protein MZV64_33735 [Ignavibacteriales bacterium]|nr:hypothetical protein [Ignavibacteriales bacterium]
MGAWLKTNGEAVYGTTASVFERLPFFGRCTVKGTTLYVHVMGWPADGRIVLPGLRTEVKKAALLTGPRPAPDVQARGPGRRRHAAGPGAGPRRDGRRRRAAGPPCRRALDDRRRQGRPDRPPGLSGRHPVRDGTARLPRPLLQDDHADQLAERQRLSRMDLHDGQAGDLRGPGHLRQHVGRSGRLRGRDRQPEAGRQDGVVPEPLLSGHVPGRPGPAAGGPAQAPGPDHVDRQQPRHEPGKDRPRARDEVGRLRK